MSHQGWIPTPPDQEKKVEQLLAGIQGSPEFSDVASHLLSGNTPKLATPYKSVQKFFPEAFEDEPQTTGDCTSHGTRNAVDISRAVEIDTGEPESWVARGATEPIYGARNHAGAGMNVGMAVEFVVKHGFLARQNYPGVIDLSKYDSRIGTGWGRSGTPKEVQELCRPCRHFARIRTVEEARAALSNGYGITCGSQYGNDGKRDARGIARWNNSWNHCMAWGAHWEDDDLYFLIHNSWGVWNKGGHPPWGPLPGGSFLIPQEDAKKMISAGECYAVSDVAGYPPKDLPDYGTGDYL